MLTGQIGTDAVTLAILDHPKNFGFPTCWHARGYGSSQRIRWDKRRSAKANSRHST